MAGAPWEKDSYDPLVTFAYQQIDLSTSASSLASATFLNAKRAVLTLEGDSARYRRDSLSSAVTTAVGVPMLAGDQIALWGSEDIQNFKIVGQSTAAKLSCEYAR